MATFLLRPTGQSCRHTAQIIPRKAIFSRLNSTVSETAKQQLSWPEYLAIRGQKRKWETVTIQPYALNPLCLIGLHVGCYNTGHNRGLRKWSLVFWVVAHGRNETNTWSRTIDLLFWVYSSMHGCVLCFLYYMHSF
jgi:hypothetical protein